MAGQSKEIVTRSAAATLNLGANVGYIVKEATNTGDVRLASAITDDILGVVWSAENTGGGEVGVCISGRCKVVAGAAFTPGTSSMYFTVDANGKARPASTATLGIVVGKILSNVVVASGDEVDCLVQPHATTSL